MLNGVIPQALRPLTLSFLSRAISDYETEDPWLLSFNIGDVINVKEKDDVSGWYRGFNFSNNKEGAFPRDLVKMLVARPKTTENARRRMPTTSTYLTNRAAASKRMTTYRAAPTAESESPAAPESIAAVPEVQPAASTSEA